ncbi:cellulose binding domain-containing protein [Spirosoma sp. KUDC1026]|uniref:cellulose binding domain-containing protein n=1 Tax=Spirosoma sp. KUDC1026 TaxID=2745947 RepID=UPI00159BE9F6|nr:cellulose binding domain-containing protein [Spirosoma sp. KUDC1026]QKZ12532.1 hypothetical protein HU175_07770 [Spirosoma sp. KUDC1026]
MSLSALVEGNTTGTYAWSLNGASLPVTTFAYTVPATTLAAPGRYVVAVRKVSDLPTVDCESAPASLTITVSPTPLIAVTPTSLSFVNSTQLPGSNPQVYTVSASNLTGNQLLITAPAPYLISVRSGSFGPTQALPVTDGAVAPTSVTVALVSSQSGTFTGAITHVAGSASATVGLSGTTLSPSLSVRPASLSGFATTAGTPSAVQTYTITALSQTGGLVTAPAGVEIRTGTDAFSSSVTIPASLSALTIPVDVRLSGAAVGPVTGVIAHQLNTSSNQSVANVTISGTVSATAPAAVLRVLHRDVDNYADNNAVQPLLQLVNEGSAPLPLSAITLRYYLTVEGTAPLSNLSIFFAQVGERNVRLRYVPLNPARSGASGYVEYSFSPDAGSLAAGANSGNIQSYFAKADYSAQNELDDYSYAMVRDQLVANPRITAYYNGTLVWGTEPSGEAGCPTIGLSASNNGTLSCGQPSLILTASGGQSYVFSSGTTPVSANQVSVSSAGLYSVTATSANGCVDVASVRVTASTTLPTPDFATRGNGAVADGLTSVTVVQNSAPVRFSAPNCSGTLSWSGNGLSGTGVLDVSTASPGVFVYQATCRVGSCVSSPASVTLTVVGAPTNQPPVAVANPNQVVTVGVPFSYTVNAFTDEEPARLVYNASLEPANGLRFDPATRVISGTPSASGVVGVTITARDAGNLSATTSFSITVSSPSVGTAVLRVLHRDVDNYADNNAVQPLLQLVNEGSAPLPLSAITLRYYLTVEGTAPLSNLSIFFAQVGERNVRLRYVAIDPARSGASGYVEYSFSPDAGSLAAGANSGNIQSYFAKADYSAQNELDDYSYAMVRDQLVANPRITAYYNGTLVWGTEPASGGRQAAELTSQLAVKVLGNPIHNDAVSFEVTGAEGQPLHLQLLTPQGRIVSRQQVPSAAAVEYHQLSANGEAAGVFLLQVSTPTQSKTVKVIKGE